MIAAFGNALAEDLFDDGHTRVTQAFPPDLRRAARRKLLYLHEAAALQDMSVPPGNRLERLKGKWSGMHSVRVNDQWRLVFRWQNNNAFDVQIIVYH